MPATVTHTPIPWTVDDRRNAPLKNIRVTAGGHEVCQLSDVHQRDYYGSFTGDHKAADAVDAVGLANANLIVRAVNCHDELLAVIGDLTERLDVLVENTPEGDEPPVSPGLMEAARAAIAKATTGST
jgi:hypothetical protein